MTTVNIQTTGGHYRLTARGHATGSPAVCAAVSALLFTLAGYLKKLEQAGEVSLDQLRLEPGRADLAAHSLRPAPDNAARGPFDMTVLGLRQIADTFPQQVQLLG